VSDTTISFKTDTWVVAEGPGWQRVVEVLYSRELVVQVAEHRPRYLHDPDTNPDETRITVLDSHCFAYTGDTGQAQIFSAKLKFARLGIFEKTSYDLITGSVP
jgi:hypothetical protein